MLHLSKSTNKVLPSDDDMRVDPSDVTLSSLSFPFIDTKSQILKWVHPVFHSLMFVSSPHSIINYIYQINYSIIDPMVLPGFVALP